MYFEAGKGYTFGSPSIEAVLGHVGYNNANVHVAADDVEWEALEALCREIEKKDMEAGKRFWWEADVEALGEAELQEFKRALQRLKDNVGHRTDNLMSALLSH
ncbi:uncharacterized protein [Aegilops tauschii subsp. strangulata]|uniref:uncharacterized protein n=1 Tax=Aegilops tauschii subsp. strangulata TaxID=200361 RepID=UPI00098A449A